MDCHVLLNGKYVAKTDPYVLSFYELFVGALVVTLVLAFQGSFLSLIHI